MNILNLSQAQKAIYKKLSEGVTAKVGTSMEFIRELIRIGVNSVNDKKAEINAKINDNNDKLSKRLADEANIQLQSELKQYTDDIKTILSKRSAEFFNAKRDTVAQFIKKMPSDSLWRKLQFINDFGNLLDKEEWEVFITDPEIASNYYASKIVMKEAEKHGVDYAISFNYNKMIDTLNDVETMVNNSIPHIGESQNSLTLLTLISNNPNSPVSKLIADIDSDIASIIPAEKLTILQRLKDASKTAYNRDNVTLSSKINAFISRHERELAEPGELRESLLAEAESFIQQGMAARSELHK